MDDYWKKSKKVLKESQDLLNNKKVEATKYVAEKARDGREYVGNAASKAGSHAYSYADQQNKRLWRFVAIKQRTLGLAKAGFRWFGRTRLFRWTRAGLVLGVIGKGCYVYGTQFEKEIEITKSFNQLRETSSGVHNTYFVADQNKKLYQVVPSLWYWQWWPDELWAFMKEGQTYKVQCYGWRIQKFRLHPRIVSAEIKSLDPTQEYDNSDEPR